MRFQVMLNNRLGSASMQKIDDLYTLRLQPIKYSNYTVGLLSPTKVAINGEIVVGRHSQTNVQIVVSPPILDCYVQTMNKGN